MMRLLKLLHLYFYVFAVALGFFLLYPFLYFNSRKPERYPVFNKFRYYFGVFSSGLAGFFYRYHYEAEIDWSRSYIICSNHFSNLDVTIISLFIKSNFAFMGKKELVDSPIFGLFFKTIDIPVDRDSKLASFRAFKRAEQYLKSGITMVIFPEGKIGEDYPPVMHPFKNGPFRLAIENNIPIIPVTIANAWEKLWDDGLKYGSRPGISDIYVHKPVETTGMTIADADELKDRVYDMISSKLTT